MKTLVLTGVADGKKIQAIKGYRALTGLDLRRAKEGIDALMDQGKMIRLEVDNNLSLAFLANHSLLYRFEYPRSLLTVWMIWVQEQDCDNVWLEAAWEDDMTAENGEGWRAEVDRVRKLCFDNNYVMRIQKVRVPGVLELFDIPEAAAEEDA